MAVDDENRRMDSTISTMDILALNNLVVSLRGFMKKVKLFTIQKLVKQSKELRIRKCSEERLKKNQQKAERLIQEVGAIKDLKIDTAIKYALANTKTLSSVAGLGDIELRAKVRLAIHPLMVERVQQWRRDHGDWKALSSFLLHKNTGRRYKKKKDKTGDLLADALEPHPPKTKVRLEKSEEKKSTKEKYVVPKIGDHLSARELAQRVKRTRYEQLHKRLQGHLQGNLTGLEERVRSGYQNEPSEIVEMFHPESSGKVRSKIETSKSNVSEKEKEGSEEGDESGTSEGEDITKRDTSKPPDDEGEAMNEESQKGGNEEESKISHAKKTTVSKWKQLEKSHQNNHIRKMLMDKSEKEPPKGKSTESVQSLKKENKSKEMEIAKIYFSSLSEIVEEIPIKRSTDTSVSFLYLPKEKKKEGRNKDTFFMVDSDEENDNDESVAANIAGSMSGGCGDGDGSDVDDQQDTKGRMWQKTESSFIRKLSNKGQRSSNRSEQGYSQSSTMEKGRRCKFGQHGRSDFRQPRYNDRRGRTDPISKRPLETTSEKLHPSWEAKRRRKEREKEIPQFQGKKITFND